MRRMSTAESAVVSSALELLVYLLLFGLHAALAGSFGLPVRVESALLVFSPAVDYIGTWAIKGLSGGGWTLPGPFPQAGTKP